jgi:hypothetical protein
LAPTDFDVATMNKNIAVVARRPPWQAATFAFLLYLLVSIVLLGHGAFAHFGSTTIGYGPDPPLFIWDLKWWPQAILDGLNPLHTSVAYAPEGFDTTLVASMAAPSIVMAPVTQLAGPLVSYNVLTILAPAVNGWAAYLLCRTAGARYWPSVAGGYLFGFSTYVLGQSLGHPFISLVAIPPLVVYLVLRHQQGSISSRWLTAALTGVLTFQFLTSSEVFLTMTMVGTAVFALALLLLPQRRAALVGTGKPLVVAYVITGLLVSPYLISTLTADQTLSHIEPIFYSADPLNLVIPTRITVGGATMQAIGERFTGNLSENGTYFGIPLLLVLALFGWQRRRDRIAMLLVGAFAIALLAALGPRLNLLGSVTAVRLPWAVFLHLPITKYVLPERIVVFAWLALGLVVALWLSYPSRRQWAKWALVGVGLIAVLPDPGAKDPRPPHLGAKIWASTRTIPELFRSGDRALFAGRPNLLVLPYNEAGNGDNLYWQASTGMAYEMPGGYLSGTVPDNFLCWPIVGQLRAQDYRRVDRAGLLAFLAAKQVDGVVAPVAEAHAAAPLLGALPGPPRRSGGVLIYRVPPMHRIATCPRPSSQQ